MLEAPSSNCRSLSCSSPCHTLLVALDAPGSLPGARPPSTTPRDAFDKVARYLGSLPGPPRSPLARSGDSSLIRFRGRRPQAPWTSRSPAQTSSSAMSARTAKCQRRCGASSRGRVDVLVAKSLAAADEIGVASLPAGVRRISSLRQRFGEAFAARGMMSYLRARDVHRQRRNDRARLFPARRSDRLRRCRRSPDLQLRSRSSTLPASCQRL